MTNSTDRSLNYSPEIDGLRAVAVLFVILFHFHFSYQDIDLLSGGFIGVDIFFVISGYLITQLLLTEMNNGSFSIQRFYLRRARRILPALFVMTLVSCIVAWRFLFIDSMKIFSFSALTSTVFFSNFYFVNHSGYFDGNLELKPLLHTWTLAVEEQFYIVYPLLLFWIHRHFPRRIHAVLGLCLLVSLFICEWSSFRYPSATFYLPHTRFWEFLAGALIVPAKSYFQKRSFPLTGVASIVAFFVLMIYGFLFNGTIRHPSMLTTVPILSVVILILFSKVSLVGLLLRSKPFVGIGLISYSLYLWHQPCLAFFRIYKNAPLNDTEKIEVLGVTFLLATLSYYFVETPFRNPTRIRQKALLVCLGIAAFALVCFGTLGVLSGGFPDRVSSKIRLKVENPQLGVHDYLADCPTERCVLGAKDLKPTITLKGDSHASMLASSLSAELKKSGKSGLVMGASIFIHEVPTFVSSFESNARWAELLVPEMETVIYSARITPLITSRSFDNQEGGVESDPVAQYSSEGQKQILSFIVSGITELLQKQKRVILLYPIPEVGWDVPLTILRKDMRGDETPITTSFEIYKSRNQKVLEAFDALKDHPNLLKIHPEDIFCDSFMKNRCVTESPDGKIFYFDDDHLTRAGSDLVVQEIIRQAIRRWGHL